MEDGHAHSPRRSPGGLGRMEGCPVPGAQTRLKIDRHQGVFGRSAQTGIMATGANPKHLSLMPREHGAYAQLGISLAMALALVPSSPRSWGQALATVLV